MTFHEQIAGVPLELVRQGWRLQPSNEFDSGWRRQSPFNRWDYEAIEVDGAYLDIARPVIERPNGPRVYAHQGWGEGLQPTLEMVKIWMWWWFADTPVPVWSATNSVLIYARSSRCNEPVMDSTKWRGPVLPPMEAT